MTTKTETKKTEKRIKIMIHKSESDTGSLQVPVSVQGKTYLIKRGEDVAVPESVVGVLKNAVKDIYEYDGKKTIKRQVLAYPFSIIE